MEREIFFSDSNFEMEHPSTGPDEEALGVTKHICYHDLMGLQSPASTFSEDPCPKSCP